jgi:hypothetical protein
VLINWLIKKSAIILLTIPFFVNGQDYNEAVHQSYLFFPYPMQEKKWHASLGVTFTTIPRVIAEEVQISVPAIDYHVLRKIAKGFYLDGRMNVQILQNHLSLGPRWTYIINNKFSFSLGDDIAWWFGVLNIEGFKTTANGWLNYPSLSAGYRINNGLLLTLKSELLINLYYQSKVADEMASYSHQAFSGWATGIILEQPFYKKTNFILGFRAIQTKFFWQTWCLFKTFKPKLFYPEFTMGINL